MEKMDNQMSRKGSNFDSDISLRRSRPSISKGNGQLVDDMGTSGFASQSSNHAPKSSGLTHKEKERVKRGIQSEPIIIPDEDDDELDLLSSELNSSEELAGKTTYNSLDIDQIRSRSDALKNLRFKKNKSEGVPKKHSVLGQKSPNLSSHPRSSSQPSKSLTKSSSQSRLSPRKSSTSSRRSRRTVTSENSDTDEPEIEEKSSRKAKGKQRESVEDTPVLKKERPKPKPKLIVKPGPKPLPVSPTKSSSSTLSPLFQPPVGKQKPLPAPDLPVATQKKNTPPNPSSFPILISPENTPKRNPPPKPSGFPVLVSPENTPKSRKPLPVNPPKSLDISRKSTGMERDDDDVLPQLPAKKAKPMKSATVPAAAPFPLDRLTQVSPSYRRTVKRLSNESTEEGDTPSKKRRRDNTLLCSPPQGPRDDDSDDDDYFYDPSVDANTLCPYCDEALPSSPTPFLKTLLATTAKKSVREPRPTNPMGLKAAVGVFINVCQRHRFETNLLPEAEEKGWPKSIEWHLIRERVMRMKDHLEALMQNYILVKPSSPKSRFGKVDDSDDENSDWEILGQSSVKYRARDKCVFWVEAMKEVKEKGTRVAANVRSQFANFQKTQPGYYGELGSVLIHQTLYELFPPENTVPDMVSPLSPKEFIDRVLLPEVAVRLIMEDKSLFGSDGSRKALQILRDSTTYGVAMFPEDSGERAEEESSKGKQKSKRSSRGKGKGKDRHRSEDEEGVYEMNKDMNVADEMVREKARRRRLELEKEDEEEQAEMIREKERNARKRKDKRKEKDPDSVVEVSSPHRPKPKPRPKPKAIQKKTSAASLVDMVVDSESEPFGIDAPIILHDESGAQILGSDFDNDDNLMSMDDLDLNEAPPSFRSTLSRSRHERSPSSTRGDSDHSMIISDSNDDQSRTRGTVRKGGESRKKKKRDLVSPPPPERSPSIEILSPPSVPVSTALKSSFDTDATPKARNRLEPSSMKSASSSSSSHLLASSSRNWSNKGERSVAGSGESGKVGAAILPSDSWSDQLGHEVNPLDFLHKRMAGNPLSSSPDHECSPKRNGRVTTKSRRRVGGSNEVITEDSVVTRRGKNRAGGTSNMVARSDSLASNADWLLEDSESN